jgi:hypothetical protein
MTLVRQDRCTAVAHLALECPARTLNSRQTFDLKSTLHRMKMNLQNSIGSIWWRSRNCSGSHIPASIVDLACRDVGQGQWRARSNMSCVGRTWSLPAVHLYPREQSNSGRLSICAGRAEGGVSSMAKLSFERCGCHERKRWVRRQLGRKLASSSAKQDSECCLSLVGPLGYSCPESRTNRRMHIKLKSSFVHLRSRRRLVVA